MLTIIGIKKQATVGLGQIMLDKILYILKMESLDITDPIDKEDNMVKEILDITILLDIMVILIL